MGWTCYLGRACYVGRVCYVGWVCCVGWMCYMYVGWACYICGVGSSKLYINNPQVHMSVTLTPTLVASTSLSTITTPKFITLTQPNPISTTPYHHLKPCFHDLLPPYRHLNRIHDFTPKYVPGAVRRQQRFVANSVHCTNRKSRFGLSILVLCN